MTDKQVKALLFRLELISGVLVALVLVMLGVLAVLASALEQVTR